MKQSSGVGARGTAWNPLSIIGYSCNNNIMIKWYKGYEPRN